MFGVNDDDDDDETYEVERKQGRKEGWKARTNHKPKKKKLKLRVWKHVEEKTRRERKKSMHSGSSSSTSSTSSSSSGGGGGGGDTEFESALSEHRSVILKEHAGLSKFLKGCILAFVACYCATLPGYLFTTAIFGLSLAENTACTRLSRAFPRPFCIRHLKCSKDKFHHRQLTGWATKVLRRGG